MPYMAELLSQLTELNLPLGQYAIFGSGPMAIRRLKQPGDLDIIVTKLLWHELAQQYVVEQLEDGGNKIDFGDIEIFDSWGPGQWDVMELIAEAEIIYGFPYVRLQRVLAWKTIRGKDKDLPDIEAMLNYGVQTQEPSL